MERHQSKVKKIYKTENNWKNECVHEKRYSIQIYSANCAHYECVILWIKMKEKKNKKKWKEKKNSATLTSLISSNCCSLRFFTSAFHCWCVCVCALEVYFCQKVSRITHIWLYFLLFKSCNMFSFRFVITSFICTTCNCTFGELNEQTKKQCIVIKLQWTFIYQITFMCVCSNGYILLSPKKTTYHIFFFSLLFWHNKSRKK